MSEPVLSENLLVYQACGEVIVIYPDGTFRAEHYGTLGDQIDQAARSSLSAIEQEGDRRRQGAGESSCNSL
jgi:hypothetical protein